MTRTMYDSVTVADLPAGAKMVAGYADGHYANVPALRKRFPHAQLVRITVEGRHDVGAQVCDCETGDLTPEQAAEWAHDEHLAGRHPTIYCNASTYPLVVRALGEIGVAADHVSWWIAEYDGDPTVPPYAVAKQYRGSPGPKGAPGTSKGHYDVSSVRPHWPGVDRGYRLSRKARRALRVLNGHLSHRQRALDEPSRRRLSELVVNVHHAKQIGGR